jgi:hypothetical protein
MTTTPTTPVYLASYKATQPGMLGLVNRAIRFFTKSQYSHSEIAIGNPFDAPAVCLSSVGVEGGVRPKTMQLSPTKWDLIELHHVTPADVLAFLQQHKGKRYDLIGCVRSVLPFVSREHPDNWFCSEVCAAIIGHPEPWRMHPGVLHAVELSRATKPSGLTNR